MRIRKNAKNSAFFNSEKNSSNDSNESLIQKNFCQLNQSPWDIITFPPSDSSSHSPHEFLGNEVYYNVNFGANGSSVDSIGAVESVASMKMPFEGENNDVNEEINEEEGEIVLCGKVDGKGWQCGRVVKNGNTMCDDHLTEAQNYAVWTTSKKSRPVSGPTGRPRRTKKLATASNPHEFYYYSGFGPSWAKKRGAARQAQDNNGSTSVAYCTTSVANDDMDIEDEAAKRAQPDTTMTAWSGQVGPVEPVFDYIDDEEEEEKEEKKIGIVGKKRGRKPIKARSLKSLM